MSGAAARGVWTNWAGDQRCAPAALLCPADEGELIAALERAERERLTVRVAGAGHSFSDIVCTDGLLLSLRHLDAVLAADRATGLVRVQAGIGLHALAEALAALGLALENQGDVDTQSLAGALATATHGTGTRFANLSSQVAAVRLVTADGAAVELDAERDPDGWRAARVSLGALGVITEVTLRCVPLFTLERVDEPIALSDALARLDELADGHDHFELFALPYADRALMRRSTRAGDRAPEPIDPRVRWLKDTLIEHRALALAGAVSRRLPRAVPALNRRLMRLTSREVRVDRSHRIYANRRELRFTEMEYAVPREHARAAVEGVLGAIERDRLPIAFPIEVRFVAGDDAPLSPAAGRATCYVAVHQHAGQPFERYFGAVEEVMDGLGGRPHWGKRHGQTAATLAPRYPGWAAFAAVRDRLDPERRFTNPYVLRVLGP